MAIDSIDASNESWNAFKLRPEVKTVGDLTGDESAKLEAKWATAEQCWYDPTTREIKMSGDLKYLLTHMDAIANSLDPNHVHEAKLIILLLRSKKI
ncbi:MAG: hypothetical protein Harvfovirus2_56 [Harvfovirus sp.]|uniref:Uncharacterized protein n=1 Tax=Harvfovirus sp. TaxID=2487768 RepID=A0A3G4ZZW7_9VIRU|nr:MAG: hypothetical protein Harvfovirus2_56 [Harvfovirus sp.]